MNSQINVRFGSKADIVASPRMVPSATISEIVWEVLGIGTVLPRPIGRTALERKQKDSGPSARGYSCRSVDMVSQVSSIITYAEQHTRFESMHPMESEEI